MPDTPSNPARPSKPDPPATTASASQPGALARPDAARLSDSDLADELASSQTDPALGAQLAPVDGPMRILFLDVDGTLTDGTIGFDANGDSRSFWIRDGIALKWARDHGILPIVISGRDSRAVDLRMQDLGLEAHQGIEDKVAVAQQVIERENTAWERCVMVGDDLPDIALMKRVGWPIAVGDADPEVVRVAKTVTRAPGGRGAVREVVEMLLRHNGTWERVLERYGAR